MICQSRNALFGHVVRPNRRPAHQALNSVVREESCHRPDVRWRRVPGRLRRTRMIQQIGDGALQPVGDRQTDRRTDGRTSLAECSGAWSS